MRARTGYLTTILRVLSEHQLQKSQLVPRAYKLLLLYYSLVRYCFLADFWLPTLNSSSQNSMIQLEIPKIGNIRDL
jgi:hypothetical protein